MEGELDSGKERQKEVNTDRERDAHGKSVKVKAGPEVFVYEGGSLMHNA